MRGFSKEQLIAGLLALALTVGGLGYFAKMQGDLSKAVKDGREKRTADIEAIDAPDAGTPPK